MSERDEFAGRRAVVMGLGRFGGGVGVTRFLVDRGAEVLVTDLDDAEKLADSLAQIRDLVDAGSVSLRLGEHNVSDFTTSDLVVVNPAVKPGNRFVRSAEAAGIEVTTEMRLLVQRLPNRLRTIGVTGSAGKSTVTAMIGHVLRKVLGDGSRALGSESNTQRPKPNTQRVWIGGNIGVSLLPVIDRIGEEDWVVLELSSFMLDRLKRDDHFRGWSPHVAVVTNISPNHLDWHGSMEAYAEAKRVILDYQKPEDRAVIGPESGLARPMNPRVETARLAEDCDRSPVRLALPGRHNRLNAMLAFSACAAARAPWVSREAAFDALADFPGLPHRLQFVKAYDGVRYFNDSKCTTPEAAMLAIEAFLDGEGLEKGVGSRFSEHEAGLDESFPKNDSRPLFQEGKFPGIHLVLGGKDKGSDMTALVSLAASRCKAVYTIGALGDTIARLVDAAGEAASAGAERPGSCGGVSWPAATAEVVRCGELERAMDEIAARVKPGDVVLLSPACASWDQFENYEARGDRFIALVESHVASSATKNPTD